MTPRLRLPSRLARPLRVLALLGVWAALAACAPARADSTAQPEAERASGAGRASGPGLAPEPTTPAPAVPAVRPAGAQLPERLSQTGLWADPVARRTAPDVWPFEPQYPLWTDGAAKRRWIRLPAGSAVDASDPDAWVFPAGTRLWKEFALGGPVETRYLEKLADGSWLRGSYLWDAEQGDALLAPAAGARGVAEVAPGVASDVPGRADCAACHARGDGVLGFGALQLSSDRDPLAPHARGELPPGQDLAAFVERGQVRGLPAELLAVPPRIEARTPRERAALGYLSTHCGSCHWSGGLLAGLGLDLRATVRDDGRRALETTVGRACRFRPPGAPDEGLARILPGAPEASALLLRLGTRQPLAQMPPLGTHLVDSEARDLLAAWIREDLAGPLPPSN